MSSIIWVMSVGFLLATVRSRVAMVRSSWTLTPFTTIRETRTPPGNAASRSANNCDQENLFRSTSPCADLSAFCCSGVSAVLIASARWLRSEMSFCSLVTSLCVAVTFALVWIVDFAIRIKAINDARLTIMATVHGKARLRKGLLARLSLAVITGTYLHQEPTFIKGYTSAAKWRKPRPASGTTATELHVKNGDWFRKSERQN